MEIESITWNEVKYSEFIDFLLSLEDIKYREFHSKILGIEKNLIGIRTPQLKEISKQISKGNWEDFFHCSRRDYYEESVIKGLILGYIKCDFEDRIRYLNNFIDEIDNWATCDIMVANFKFLKKEGEKYFNFIKSCAKSDEPWRIRVALVSMLDFYLTDEHVDEILFICSNIKNENYYVKMSQAWLISIIFIKFKEKVLEYFKNNKIDIWVQNKAIQKIVESRRVSTEDKKNIINFKRNLN